MRIAYESRLETAHAQRSDQPRRMREPADQRLAAFRDRRGWQFGVLGAFLTISIFLSFIGLGVAEVWRGQTNAPPVDFVVFWGSAKLAFDGNWIGAFDSEALRLAHGAQVDDWFPWAYPPGFLLVLTPLGALSFPSAWLIFTAVSLTAFALALRAFTGRVLPVWLAFAFAPAYLPSLMLGQTSLLWMAGLLGALAAMLSGRPILAGVLIGCLTLKPQLGLLIPIALVAARQWTTTASAITMAVLISAIPTLFFGVEYWDALQRVGHTHFEFMKDRAFEFHLMPSIYAELRYLGFTHSLAISFQWIAATAAALVVWQSWSNQKGNQDLQAAVLISAIPVSTPYLWYYDSAFVALSALFLLRAGILTFDVRWFPLVMVFWLGAGLAAICELLSPNVVVPIRDIVLPILLLAFAIAARASLQETLTRRSSGAVRMLD